MNIYVANIRGLSGNTEGLVIIDRRSALGNPFKMRDESKRDRVIEKYRIWLWEQMQSDTQAHRELKRLLKLASEGPLILGCWCAPKRCHAEIVRNALLWMAKQDPKRFE